eukprot:6175826-Prymnesium_polylepis.1
MGRDGGPRTPRNALSLSGGAPAGSLQVHGPSTARGTRSVRERVTVFFSSCVAHRVVTSLSQGSLRE